MNTWVLVFAVALVAGFVAVFLFNAMPSGGQGAELVLNRRRLNSIHSFVYTIFNKGTKPISLGEAYDIQYRTDGEWVSVAWLKEVVWPAVLYTVQPGESFSREVQIPEDAPSGSYRLVKKIYIDDVERVLTAEFEVAG